MTLSAKAPLQLHTRDLGSWYYGAIDCGLDTALLYTAALSLVFTETEGPWGQPDMSHMDPTLVLMFPKLFLHYFQTFCIVCIWPRGFCLIVKTGLEYEFVLEENLSVWIPLPWLFKFLAAPLSNMCPF